MMSFENFDNFMNKLIDKFQTAEDFYNKIDAALGNCACEPIIEHSGLYLAVQILAAAVGDKNEWVEYFFYEANMKPFTVEVDGRETIICNNKDLYQLISGVI